VARPGSFKRSPQWWKHLRDFKRVFWKSERKAAKLDAKNRED
jgi:hypothetical protein